MTPELPVVDAVDLPGLDDSDGERVGDVVGVVLAAGTSTRFGEANKLLATVDGDPLVRHAARTLLDAGLDTVVVLGHEAGRVREALTDLDVAFVENTDYESGQATSVRTGVTWAAGHDAEAAVFLPGDMPFVVAESVTALVRAYRGDVGTALAAAHDGQRGNPVLFGHEHFGALGDVEGDVGGRQVLLGGGRSALVAVPDSGVLVDVDTEDDLSADQ